MSRLVEPITIADYDPSWPAKFLTERADILSACGESAFVRIEHIGSTAVPGLAAKPIIDMMPGVVTLDDAPPLIERLTTLGYEYIPAFEKPIPELNDPGMPFRRYLRKDVDDRRAFQIHMVEVTSDFWRDHLTFREYLRAHPEAAKAYELLKRKLAASFNQRLTPTSDINLGYTDGKSDFVQDCLARAKVLVREGKLVVDV